MKYSFDDLHIGIMDESGSSLETRVIPRPPGLVTVDWYIHAGNVCRLLNQIKNEVGISNDEEVRSNRV